MAVTVEENLKDLSSCQHIERERGVKTLASLTKSGAPNQHVHVHCHDSASETRLINRDVVFQAWTVARRLA
jgi:hypothetical protein